ncbi:uncharacterized protein [Clytia hemisphaerica]|uniref:Cnidarian restricted protein n=1 Tax=Clytia hemisphaerica TaxID=252671 RepID=A0A7M5WRD8_9CNID
MDVKLVALFAILMIALTNAEHVKVEKKEKGVLKIHDKKVEEEINRLVAMGKKIDENLKRLAEMKLSVKNEITKIINEKYPITKFMKGQQSDYYNKRSENGGCCPWVIWCCIG